MEINVITIFPEMFDILKKFGVFSRAIKSRIVDLNVFDLRDYTEDKHRMTEDYPFGGGSGLVMKAQPFFSAYESISKEDKPYVIYPSPQGKLFNNDIAKDFAKKKDLLFLCGRYEGIDERIMDIVDCEISIGDFILNGAEQATMIMIEAIGRFISGVVGSEESVEKDSFNNDLLDCSHYTRPREIKGKKVPDYLLSGNHGRIDLERRKESLLRTIKRRPDLFIKHDFDMLDKKALISLFQEIFENVE